MCDSLAAGISLGMDVNDVYGNCAAREDRCDGPCKPRAAVTDRLSLAMVLVHPWMCYQSGGARCLCRYIDVSLSVGTRVSIPGYWDERLQVWVTSQSQTSHRCDMRCVVSTTVQRLRLAVPGGFSVLH